MAAREPTFRAHELHMIDDGGASYSLHYVVVEGLGTVTLEICGACSYVMASCLHTQNEWTGVPDPDDLDGGTERLLCRLCKIDGT